MKPINPEVNGRQICNAIYKGPSDMVSSLGVGCADLPAFTHEGEIMTFWKPDEEELALLVAGQVVMLTCYSAQTPVSMQVTKEID